MCSPTLCGPKKGDASASPISFRAGTMHHAVGGEFGNAPNPALLGKSVQETFVPHGKFYICMACRSNTVNVPTQKNFDFRFMVNERQ